MKIMMADGKESTTVESPTYIVTPGRDDTSTKGKITKKHVVIGVMIVVVIAIILAAILIGVHMFSESQKEIVKFSLQFKGSDNEDVNQDVESDPNDNVVMTTVTKGDQVAIIVNDFNKMIQTVKMITPDGTNCYVNALNKSLAMDPEHITGANSMDTETNNREHETFLISDEPVSDRSFLAKKAIDVCKGVSVYWVTRTCGSQLPDNSTVSDRVKRTVYNMAPFHGMPGKGGCCKAYWACRVTMNERILGNLHICTTFVKINTCCGIVARPWCQHWYSSNWKTPKLFCPNA